MKDQLTREEAKDCWSNILDKDIQYVNQNSDWFNSLKGAIDSDKPAHLEDIKKVFRNMLIQLNPNSNQGFWLKNLTSLHSRLTEQLNKCLRECNIPGWMTKGRTVLIVKDAGKGNITSNFRPITCLSLGWKLLT